MKVVSTVTEIPSVDSDSINKDEVYSKLKEIEDSVESDNVAYQAMSRPYNFFSEFDSPEDILDGLNRGSMRFLVAPSNYPEEPHSEPFTITYETDYPKDFREKFTELNKTLGSEYEIDSWDVSGLTSEYMLDKDERDEVRQRFVEDSSEMPLRFTAYVNIGIEDKIRIGWFTEKGKSEYGYWLKPGRSDQVFSSETAKEEIEGYLENLEFTHRRDKAGFDQEEIRKILEFDEFMIEEDLF